MQDFETQNVRYMYRRRWWYRHEEEDEKSEVSWGGSRWGDQVDEKQIYSTGSDSGAAETFMLLSTAIISARMSRIGWDESVHGPYVQGT